MAVIGFRNGGLLRVTLLSVVGFGCDFLGHFLEYVMEPNSSMTK